MALSRAVVWPVFHTCTILAVVAVICWIYIFMDGLGKNEMYGQCPIIRVRLHHCICNLYTI